MSEDDAVYTKQVSVMVKGKVYSYEREDDSPDFKRGRARTRTTRECLKCTKHFNSFSKFNRLCDLCRETNERHDPILSYEVNL